MSVRDPFSSPPFFSLSRHPRGMPVLKHLEVLYEKNHAVVLGFYGVRAFGFVGGIEDAFGFLGQHGVAAG